MIRIVKAAVVILGLLEQVDSLNWLSGWRNLAL